jgi:hypothetical protein
MAQVTIDPNIVPGSEQDVLRPGFAEISSGWMLVYTFEEVTDRIERLAKWSEANNPVTPFEYKTVQLMIEAQMVLGCGIDM